MVLISDLNKMEFQLNQKHIQKLVEEAKQSQDLLVEFYKELKAEEQAGNEKSITAIQVDIVIVYAKLKEARKQLEKLGFRM